MSLQARLCRPLLPLLLFTAVFCTSAAAEQRAPSGRAVMAWHVTIAPAWFDPSTAPPQITPFGMLYAIHDALVRPYPGQKMGPSLAESWTESEDGLIYEFKLRPNLKFHNGDPLTTEDVKFSFDRYHGAAAKTLHEHVTQVEIVDPRVVRFHLERAVARFHDLLRHDGQRRRHRPAEEVPHRGRRRRLQEASDRRRSVQVRQHQAGHRGRARSVPRLLAARAEREDAGDAQRPRSHHARADGADRRGRHRLCARRPRCRGAAEGTGRADRGDEARLDLLDRVRQAVGPEIAVARRAAAAGGELRARPQGHQPGGVPRLLPAGRRDRAARDGVRAAGRAAAVRSGEGEDSCWPRPAIPTASTPATSPRSRASRRWPRRSSTI